ncbi:hypothetical protein [Actinocrispum wychmicini]|uniref:Uncharacterized protein n=1 Tax=Actinocrispum wychmicini TaxID=1213861 RepID=A0A4R2JJP9_9PSEU|nr:hypothetical protein [Actinocrispum wychmicini]TCO57246.1 hypothetical protein EV192_106723 [Actinocrispum wychmicini]
MRRILVAIAGGVLITSFAATPVVAAPQQSPKSVSYNEKLRCDEGSPLCAEPVDSIGRDGSYTGHDEPSTVFYSNKTGAGTNAQYQLTIPKDPIIPPKQDGTGGTFNFQNRIAFWFGIALCDNQSAPEFTHAPCVAGSDRNISDNPDPTKPDYVGRHPGGAFMELQFYPPGWAPFQNGISCDARKWCAAMAIFSFNRDMNAGVDNNAACVAAVGLEPANFAFITKDGKPQAPAAPLSQTTASFTPDPAHDLFMNAGDRIAISIHDTPAGLVTALNDHSTGQSGFMTASVANGFAQVNFQPTATTCSQSPYAFHPMYATSSEHTRVPWAAHSYNVSFSDEIGHFEYCANIANGTCTSDPTDPGSPDADDVGCHTPAESLRIKIGGCTGSDADFDGPSYLADWPGSNPNPFLDRLLHPRSVEFTSPTFNGGRNYDRVAFEADMPRIEAADFGGKCDRTTGTNCVNPPPGAAFYPLFSIRDNNDLQGGGNDGCVWQLGGTHIPGTTNTFGGTTTAEFGPLLFLDYPAAGFKPNHITNDFRRVIPNPCRR